jgi:heme/copper-type cytochrome/quinol oxidase subunit 1
VGRLFIGASLVAIVAGLVCDLLVRIDLTDPDDFVVLDADTFGQTFTLARDLVVYMGVVPLFLGIAMYIVPLQVGAASLAFPRAALASFWGWVLASVVLLSAYGINGGPYGGETEAVDLYLVALAGVIVALLLGAVCVATTVLNLRAPGLFVDQLPPFSWASLVSAVMLLLTLPVILGQLALLYIDHRYGQTYLGGNFGIYTQLEWVFRSPQLYILAVPALGAIGEVMPVWGRNRQVHPTAVAVAIAAFGFFGFGAFVQLANEPETLDDYEGVVLAAFHVGAAVAAIALLGLWGMTMVRGKALPRLDSALLCSLAAGLVLVIAVLHGAIGAVIDWTDVLDRDVPLRFTTFTTGMLTLAAGAMLLAAFAALLYWAPKLWGRRLLEPIGLLSLLAALGGALLGWLGPTVAGAFQDQPEFVFDDPNATSLYGAIIIDVGNADAFSAIGAAGVGLLALGVVLMVLNLLVSVVFRAGADADADPWQAQTAEWQLPSPPEPGPVEELPDLTTGTPLLPDETAVDGEEPAALPAEVNA